MFVKTIHQSLNKNVRSCRRIANARRSTQSTSRRHYNIFTRIKDPSKGARYVEMTPLSSIAAHARGSRAGFAIVGGVVIGLIGISVVAFQFKTEEIVPISNRKRSVWIPKQIEELLGDFTYEDILKSSKKSIYPENHPFVERVRRVGLDIVSHTPEMPKYNWRFTVIHNDNIANAFVLPGGAVVVYTGMLRQCTTDDLLATVMGHEIGHVVARHSAERLSTALLAAASKFFLSSFSNSTTLVNGVYKLSFELPKSRLHESEADLIGIVLMARAGYCPCVAPVFWQRFADMAQKKKNIRDSNYGQFLSTHPASASRARALEKQLPRALKIHDDYINQHYVLTRWYRHVRYLITGKQRKG